MCCLLFLHGAKIGRQCKQILMVSHVALQPIAFGWGTPMYMRGLLELLSGLVSSAAQVCLAV